MASFTTHTQVEDRCKAQIVAKVWVVAHYARSVTGAIVARFIRYMSPTNPGHGAWVETDQDNVD